MRKIKKFVHPDDQLVVPPVTRGRCNALPPGMRKRCLQGWIKSLEGMLPGADAEAADEAKSLLKSWGTSPKKVLAASAANRSSSSGAGPSGVKPSPPPRSPGTRSPAGTGKGKKKICKEDKMKGFPITPKGMSKCPGKL